MKQPSLETRIAALMLAAFPTFELLQYRGLTGRDPDSAILGWGALFIFYALLGFGVAKRYRTVRLAAIMVASFEVLAPFSPLLVPVLTMPGLFLHHAAGPWTRGIFLKTLLSAIGSSGAKIGYLGFVIFLLIRRRVKEEFLHPGSPRSAAEGRSFRKTKGYKFVLFALALVIIAGAYLFVRVPLTVTWAGRTLLYEPSYLIVDYSGGGSRTTTYRSPAPSWEYWINNRYLKVRTRPGPHVTINIPPVIEKERTSGRTGAEAPAASRVNRATLESFRYRMDLTPWQRRTYENVIAASSGVRPHDLPAVRTDPGKITEFLDVSELDRTYFDDVIVVLGNMPLDAVTPSLDLVTRALKGVELLLAHPDAILVMTGGRTAGPVSEAEMMGVVAWSRGIDTGRILLEDEARTTEENADFTARLMAGSGVGKPFLVSKKEHLEWAVPYFRKHAVFKDIVPVDCGVTFEEIEADMRSFLETHDSETVRQRVESIRRDYGVGTAASSQREPEIAPPSPAVSLLETAWGAHDRKTCEDSGGAWNVSPWQVDDTMGYCNIRTTDAGKVCRDESECQAYCVADDNGIGHCFHQTSTRGYCLRHVQNGRVDGGAICSD